MFKNTNEKSNGLKETGAKKQGMDKFCTKLSSQSTRGRIGLHLGDTEASQGGGDFGRPGGAPWQATGVSQSLSEPVGSLFLSCPFSSLLPTTSSHFLFLFQPLSTEYQLCARHGIRDMEGT